MPNPAHWLMHHQLNLFREFWKNCVEQKRREFIWCGGQFSSFDFKHRISNKLNSDLFLSMPQMWIAVSRIDWLILRQINWLKDKAKVTVTFNLRLRNKFLLFPAKTKASNWLTCLVSKSEAWFFTGNGWYSLLNLR